MPAGQVEEILALALVFAVHVVGGLMLVWALLDDEQRAGWRRRWGGGGPPAPPSEPDGGGGGGAHAPRPLPLPGGGPSRVRLREPVRAAEGYPRPARRPAHPRHPEREPALPASLALRVSRSEAAQIATRRARYQSSPSCLSFLPSFLPSPWSPPSSLDCASRSSCCTVPRWLE